MPATYIKPWKFKFLIWPYLGKDFIKIKIYKNELLKYMLLGFSLFIFITIFSPSFKNTIQVNGISDQIGRNIPAEEGNYNGHISGINNTFYIEGALISTLYQNLSALYPDVYNNTAEKHAPNLTQLMTPTDIKKGNTTIVGSQSEAPQQQQQTLFPIPKPISPNITNFGSNGSESISDNLVSLLSGIILESIQNGNPTINNDTIDVDSNKNNSKENEVIVSGKWNMDVENGNITNFNAKFVMITSNGTGFHWHSMDNLKSKEKLFLGNDGTAIIDGKLDFFTGGNTTKQPTDVLLAINKLESIQITLLDKEISNHFFGFPIYGTIDSIKIKN